MKVIQIRDRTHKTNVGSRACLPAAYFPLAHEVVDHETPIPKGSAVIFGGGGRICGRQHRYTQHVLTNAAVSVAWGVGVNEQVGRIEFPDYLRRFTLCGLRDWPNPYRWVPCASCMSPLFDMTHEITREVAVYFHPGLKAAGVGVMSATMGAVSDGQLRRYPRPKTLDRLTFGAQVMDNERYSFREVIAFLASAETVVTDSYHGAYWATLLGRRVAVIPHNTRMLAMKHAPAVIWPDADRIEPQAHPEALAECRQATLDFLRDVMDRLGQG